MANKTVGFAREWQSAPNLSSNPEIAELLMDLKNGIGRPRDDSSPDIQTEVTVAELRRNQEVRPSRQVRLSQKGREADRETLGRNFTIKKRRAAGSILPANETHLNLQKWLCLKLDTPLPAELEADRPIEELRHDTARLVVRWKEHRLQEQQTH